MALISRPCAMQDCLLGSHAQYDTHPMLKLLLKTRSQVAVVNKGHDNVQSERLLGSVCVCAILGTGTPVVSRRNVIKEGLESWEGDHAVMRINGQGGKRGKRKI